MKQKLLIISTIAAMSLAVALGIFSIVQIANCKTLNTKVSTLQSQNKKLQNQVNNLNSQGQTNTDYETAKSLNGKKVAYLTFDDGPSINTPHLLDELKSYNVKATFFVIGKDTPQRREWMKMEVEGGNVIGIHSWTHDYNYIYSDENNFLTDFNEIRTMIISATGVTPKYLRFPGGTNNTVSIRVHHGVPIMPKLLQDVENMGITPVDWNAGGMDAVCPVPSKEAIANGVVNQCSDLKSAVILLHDSEQHESSVEAVPEIIEKLRAMGFTFEPLSADLKVIVTKPAMVYKK